MVQIQDSVQVQESLLAKKDAIVTGPEGDQRKVFAGTVVPYELREELGIDLPYDDSSSAPHNKSDDSGVPGDEEVSELPGDETLITPAGTSAPKKKSSKK